MVPLALLVLALSACGKKEPVVVPPADRGPATTPPSSTPNTGGATTPTTPGDNPEAVRTRLLADLGNVIHFDYDQDLIKPEDRPILDRKSEIMRANPALRIRISGHADERGSDEYNLVLGNKRALAAKQYLVGKGIDASRIEVTSFGEERPVDSSGTEAAFAQNRRAEFEVTAGGDRLVRPS
jgi:peptidoglycan-associated lipoprotein